MAKRKRGRSKARRNPPAAARRRSGSRRRGRARRNPPAFASRRSGVLGAVLAVPVRGAAVLGGMALARTAATLTAPTPGVAQSPFIPFGMGAAAAIAAAAASAMFRDQLLKAILADVAAGAAAGATKNLVTAYWPEAQQFLGRHDDVMYFTRPGYSRPALAGYAGGLSSYPAPALAGYSSSGVPAYQ